MSTAREDVKARIEAVEQSYEYFLAYAAQGLSTDHGARSGAPLRDFLGKMDGAIEGFVPSLRSLLSDDGIELGGNWEHMLGVLEADASATLAAIRLVAARPGISSQLIDNLNGNIHLRALIMDLFLVEGLIERG